ncbi:MAG TPA: CDP-alcohol phosphatidyltransferase family protein [Stenomitos sp.]
MSRVTKTRPLDGRFARLVAWFPPLAHVNPPNLVTSTSVALAFWGLMLLSTGRPEGALLCGLLTIPCDLVDGALARRLGLQSSFGAALDSLADAVSFCLLPAAVAHGVGLSAGFQQGLLLLYVLAGVWRLAHFEAAGLIQWRGRPAFVGVPTPYAASVLYLLACLALRVPGEPTRFLLTVGVLLLALAMVSGLPFRKGGWHYHVMWALLPLGAVVACWK